MAAGSGTGGDGRSSPEDLRAIGSAVEEAASEVGGDLLAAVYLYGSRARGRRTALSDVDLAILFRDGVSEEERWEELPALGSAVARALADGGSGAPEVDVHDLDALPLAVQGRVLTEGRLLLSRHEVRRVRFEETTRRRYFDFLPFLRRDTERGLRGLRERIGGG